MGWTYSDQVVKPVVKFDGQCYNKAQWKYCPYWVARHRADAKTVVSGFRCQLFDADKPGIASLPQCNSQYGRNYDGNP